MQPAKKSFETAVKKQQEQPCRYGNCEKTKAEAIEQQQHAHGGGFGLQSLLQFIKN